jgi:hypothetical protein
MDVGSGDFTHINVTSRYPPGKALISRKLFRFFVVMQAPCLKCQKQSEPEHAICPKFMGCFRFDITPIILTLILEVVGGMIPSAPDETTDEKVLA